MGSAHTSYYSIIVLVVIYCTAGIRSLTILHFISAKYPVDIHTTTHIPYTPTQKKKMLLKEI